VCHFDGFVIGAQDMIAIEKTNEVIRIKQKQSHTSIIWPVINTNATQYNRYINDRHTLTKMVYLDINTEVNPINAVLTTTCNTAARVTLAK